MIGNSLFMHHICLCKGVFGTLGFSRDEVAAHFGSFDAVDHQLFFIFIPTSHQDTTANIKGIHE
jgi:hypothetical protein